MTKWNYIYIYIYTVINTDRERYRVDGTKIIYTIKVCKAKKEKCKPSQPNTSLGKTSVSTKNCGDIHKGKLYKIRCG